MVWLGFIRVCKYDTELFFVGKYDNEMQMLCLIVQDFWFLGAGLPDVLKSHSTVQSDIIGQHVINFNNMNLISFFLGGKERDEGKGNKDFLK